MQDMADLHAVRDEVLSQSQAPDFGRGDPTDIDFRRGREIYRASTATCGSATPATGRKRSESLPVGGEIFESVMKLVVFDLDGTLANTNDVDEGCFVQAFTDAVDLRDLNENWLDYQHITDLGITAEAFIQRFGREPTAREISKIVERFTEL